MEVIDYSLITSDSAAQLQEQVKQAIANGWRPLGGVAIAAHTENSGEPMRTETKNLFCQAMVQTRKSDQTLLN